ncbi:DUF2778 domain-containing protein [Propionivibrio soli]|uniref:DUF2778 domain-containing protein n=1 Tax=Propionivibrio soli TaxID=2976531 RepID=UPI0021E92EC3|nr:DUF2778 domain-containing protein [Propionivibrio soli]
MSALQCGASSFPAFSGLGGQANRREYACHASAGPIPPGTYYIVDRQSGGLLGPLRDMFNDRREWFALYAIDDKIDDTTYCNKIKRGSFRLHPKGPLGISEGCITIESQSDFQRLRALLKGSAQIAIPGTTLKAYGKVLVK